MDNKHIYIVISKTGTVVSRIIKFISRKEYSHASISLSSDLQRMYSFGRIYPYAIFPAGFVREAPDISTFKRFHKSKIIVLEVDVSEEVYKSVEKRIMDMFENREKYHYNYKGLFNAAVKQTYPKRKNYYYCSEFVTEVLEDNNLINRQEFPDIVHPMNFLNMPWKEIYRGRISEYK